MCFTGFDNWTLFNSSTCPPVLGWVSHHLIRIHPEYLLKFSNRAGLSNSLFFRSLIYCLVLGIFRKVLGGYRISGTIQWVAWFLVISTGELVNLDSNSATFGVESIRLCAHRLSWPTGGKAPGMSSLIRRMCELSTESMTLSGLRDPQAVLLSHVLDHLVIGWEKDPFFGLDNSTVSNLQRIWMDRRWHGNGEWQNAYVMNSGNCFLFFTPSLSLFLSVVTLPVFRPVQNMYLYMFCNRNSFEIHFERVPCAALGLLCFTWFYQILWQRFCPL